MGLQDNKISVLDQPDFGSREAMHRVESKRRQQQSREREERKFERAGNMAYRDAIRSGDRQAAFKILVQQKQTPLSVRMARSGGSMRHHDDEVARSAAITNEQNSYADRRFGTADKDDVAAMNGGERIPQTGEAGGRGEATSTTSASGTGGTGLGGERKTASPAANIAFRQKMAAAKSRGINQGEARGLRAEAESLGIDRKAASRVWKSLPGRATRVGAKMRDAVSKRKEWFRSQGMLQEQVDARGQEISRMEATEARNAGLRRDNAEARYQAEDGRGPMKSMIREFGLDASIEKYRAKWDARDPGGKADEIFKGINKAMFETSRRLREAASAHEGAGKAELYRKADRLQGGIY